MKTWNREAAPCCPQCGWRRSYQLGDGRKKCRKCGRKFTPARLRRRLPGRTLRLIALYFWHMVPAARVSADLGLNPKTVQRHYRLLREAICTCSGNEDGPDHQIGPGGGNVPDPGRPVFGLFLRGARIRIVFSPPVPQKTWAKINREGESEADALFYAGSAGALRKMDLADFFFALPHSGGSGAPPKGPQKEVLAFWDFARRLQKLYRGRGTLSLRLFFREVEFRFNNRDNPEILQMLCGLLKNGDF